MKIASFYFAVFVIFLLLSGCAAKQPEEKIVYVQQDFIECPAPARPELKLLPSGHVGSKKVLSTVLENFNLLELYSNQLENTVTCYEKQVTEK